MSEKAEKLYYKVLKPILFGGRQEAGTFVKMTKDDAENIGEDYVTRYDPTELELAGQVNTNSDESNMGSYEDDDEEGGDAGDDEEAGEEGADDETGDGGDDSEDDDEDENKDDK